MRRVVSVVVLVVLAGLASVGGAEGVAGRPAITASAPVARSAELVVSAATVRLAGSVVAGSATVANVGVAGARSSTAAVAWRSSAGGGGLVELGRFKVPALRRGERHKASFRVAVPKGAAGSYDVSVCADVLGQVQARDKHKSKCRSAGVVTIPASGVKGYGPTGSEPSPPSGSGGSSSSGSSGGSSPPPTGSASSPPETVIDSGPTGLIGESAVTFTFHGSDADDTFQCALDGAPWAPCTSPQQYTALAEGTHTFQVRAVNAAGEVDPTPASASFTVEATPPQTTITSAPHGRIPTGEVSIAFTATEAGSTFQCSLDGGGYSPCSSPYVIASPAAGPHTFSVQATNQAGVKETTASPSASWSSVEAQHDLCGTISSNTTIGPDYAARYILTCSTTIASASTLTAQPGTIIKADSATSLTVHGTLNAIGTEAEPDTFTSINDNTIGGTTGNGSPTAGDWGGISVGQEGSLSLEHTDIRYARTGISASGPAAFEVRDSTIENSLEVGIVFDGSGFVTVPVVDGDTITKSGGPATEITSGDLDPAELDGNSGSENHGELMLAGVFATSGTLSESTLHVQVGLGTNGPEDLAVDRGVTLTIPAGQTVQGTPAYYTDPTFRSHYLDVQGALDSNGTASEPVVFTSSAGEPEPGDWGGISVGQEGSLSLEHTDIRYAATGIAFGGTTGRLQDVAITNDRLGVNVERGSLSLRGTLANDESGVQACDWGTEGCSADAAYTYWGPAGPFPSGTAALACGAVTTSPYLTTPSGAATEDATSAFGSENCDGSPTPSQEFASAQQSATERISGLEIECGDGLEEACELIAAYEKCMGAATTLAEQSSPFDFSNGAQSVAADGASLLEKSENAVVSTLGSVASTGLEIFGVASTVIDIAHAYDTCSP